MSCVGFRGVKSIEIEQGDVRMRDVGDGQSRRLTRSSGQNYLYRLQNPSNERLMSLSTVKEQFQSSGVTSRVAKGRAI